MLLLTTKQNLHIVVMNEDLEYSEGKLCEKSVAGLVYECKNYQFISKTQALISPHTLLPSLWQNPPQNHDYHFFYPTSPDQQ